MPRVKKHSEEEEDWTEASEEEVIEGEEEEWTEGTEDKVREEEEEEEESARKAKKKRNREPLTKAEKEGAIARTKGKRQWNIDNVPDFLANESKLNSPYQKPKRSLPPDDQAQHRRVKDMWARKDRARKDWKYLIALKEQKEKEEHDRAVRKREEERDTKCIAAIQKLMKLDEEKAKDKSQKSLKQKLADIEEEEQFILQQLHLMYQREKKKKRRERKKAKNKSQKMLNKKLADIEEEEQFILQQLHLMYRHEKKKKRRERKEEEQEDEERKVRKRKERQRKKKEEEERMKVEQERKEEEQHRKEDKEKLEERRRSRRLAKYEAAAAEAKIKLAVGLERLQASREGGGQSIAPEAGTSSVGAGEAGPSGSKAGPSGSKAVPSGITSSAKPGGRYILELT